MKRLLFILLRFAFLFSALAFASSGMQPVGVPNGSAQGGGPSYLLEDTFTAANGTNIVGYNSWTAEGSDPGDYLEIQSNEAYFNQTGTSTAYVVYHTFAEQTTGYLTVEFDFIFSNDSDTETKFFGVSDGAYTGWTTGMLTLEQYYNGFRYFNSGWSWSSIGADYLTVDTPAHIELEINIDSSTFNLWVDTVQVATNEAIFASGSPDRIAFSIDTPTTYISNCSVDNLQVYAGQRQ